jgi:pyridoxamine 5'-phosphate oxidase
VNPDHFFGTDVGLDDPVADPLALLRRWLAPCDGTVTPLMTLSTIGLDGYPDSRHVLLSSCDSAGRIAFHTDAGSRKAAELAALPRASVAVVWPGLARQLVVTGDVAVQDEAGQRAAYAHRSRYLQLLAWLNTDAAAAGAIDARHTEWSAYDTAHATLEPPPTWIGYLLTPLRIVFWRGDAAGPSNRVLCTREGSGWSVERRAG